MCPSSNCWSLRLREAREIRSFGSKQSMEEMREERGDWEEGMGGSPLSMIVVCALKGDS